MKKVFCILLTLVLLTGSASNAFALEWSSDTNDFPMISEELPDDSSPIKVAVPSSFKVRNKKEYVHLSWKKHKTADAIQIQYTTDRNFKKNIKRIIVSKNRTGYDLKNIPLTQRVYIRIRARQKQGNRNIYSDWSRTASVILQRVRLEKLSIEAPSKMLAKGQKMTLTPVYTPANASEKETQWSSSNTSVARVSESGVVTGLKVGIVTITATCQGKSARTKIRINPKGIITIIDDDSHKEFLTRMLPIAKEKNISISSAVIVKTLGKTVHMSWKDLKTIEKEGCEILCHTYNHWLYRKAASKSQQELEEDYGQAVKKLKEHGFDNADKVLIYPGRSGKLPQVQQAASKFFEYGITSNGKQNNYLDTDNMYLARYNIQTSLMSGTKEAKDWIDKTVREGGWMIWMTHCYNEEVDDTLLKNLRKVIDYAKEQGVEFVSASEGLDRIF